jgi:methyl-accepting chemotaxis protein
MIGAVKTDADSAVAAMGKSLAVATATQNKARQAGTALEQIARNVYQINERNLVIASASEQQAQVAREVDKNLHNIQQLSEQI